MEYGEKNYSIIKQKHPHLIDLIKKSGDSSQIDIHISKNGNKVPSIIRNGKKNFLHSKFDPEKEALRFISEISTDDYDLFIVFGFGFAYHIDELLGRISADSVLLVIEKEINILAQAFRERDLSGLLSDERVIILVDPHEDEISERMKGRASKSVTFVTHRGSYGIYPEYYNNMLQICRSYISTKEVNIATLAKFEKTWTANISRNIKRFSETPGINHFYNRFAGLPALVVCAGPSLDKSLDYIRANQRRCVLIAVDTALRILLKNDIEPHFCICVDPQVINARYFEGIKISKTILVTDPTVHPSVFRLFSGRAITTGIAFEMMKWIEKRTGDKGEVAHGGSVSTNAYDFARRIGASPVFLTGQDLAFTGGLAHCPGSYLDEQIHLKTRRNLTAEMFNRKQLRALPEIKVKGIKSDTVSTNQKMMIFLAWFQKQNDPDLINLTCDGAYINGIKHDPEEDHDLEANNLDIDSLIDSVYAEAIAASAENSSSRVRMTQDVDKMLKEIDELIPVLEKAVVFSGNLETEFGKDNRDRGKIDYILKKLSGVDEFIEKKISVKDMISFTVQRVIHTITEGYEIDENDKDFSKEQLIARRSLFLYNGLLEGTLFNRKVLNKMNTILK